MQTTAATKLIGIDIAIITVGFQSFRKRINIIIANPTNKINGCLTNLEKFTFGLDASRATSYSANADFKYSTDANGNALGNTFVKYSPNVPFELKVKIDDEYIVNKEVKTDEDAKTYAENQIKQYKESYEKEYLFAIGCIHHKYSIVRTDMSAQRTCL